ncbi:hypothetical protein PV10_01623 [Exophiala mesophila]|uniref:Uncharacterized protein n=1 Tax=Exophiala mesophila TaxID=212818 RepID=A0A0D1ZTN3_EXOME|nr:uncharacterized protein PV10_01623 [Exophiala mesophila]KIV97922.1 hypothetical protein PV10_01623 [Exophiala mesophila]
MASKHDTVTPWTAVLGSPNRKRALFQSSFPPILPSTKKGRSDEVVTSRISPHQPNQRHQPQSDRRHLQLISPYLPSSILKNFSTYWFTTLSLPFVGSIHDQEPSVILLDLNPQLTPERSALIPLHTLTAEGSADETIPLIANKSMDLSLILAPRNNLVPWLQKHAGPPVPATHPKRIIDLPPEVIVKILKITFIREQSEEETYYPSYRQGMLAGYIRVGTDPKTGQGDEVKTGNVPIPINVMQTCRLFHKISCSTFYGDNIFSFKKPRVCFWWLKHIGQKNVSYLRGLRLYITSGIDLPHQARSCFDLTAEENWLQVLQYLRTRHRLEWLALTFDTFIRSDLPEDGLSSYAQEIMRYRSNLNLELHKWRGIRTVTIHDPEGYLGDTRNSRKLEFLIRQPDERSSNEIPRPKKPVSLASLMKSIRLQNKEKDEAACQQRHQHILTEGLLQQQRNLLLEGIVKPNLGPQLPDHDTVIEVDPDLQDQDMMTDTVAPQPQTRGMMIDLDTLTPTGEPRRTIIRRTHVPRTSTTVRPGSTSSRGVSKPSHYGKRHLTRDKLPES